MSGMTAKDFGEVLGASLAAALGATPAPKPSPAPVWDAAFLDTLRAALAPAPAPAPDAAATLEALWVKAAQAREERQGQAPAAAVRATLTASQVVVAGNGLPEDPYWPAQRAHVGLLEQHTNALYLTAALLHTDRANGNGDVISYEEAAAALPTLIGQPLDVARDMGGHERERLSGVNGIRGFVYAARLQGDALEIGAILWARDFPDIAQSVADFRASLGASFDLVAKTADHLDAPVWRYGAEEAARPRRLLKGITFLGGSVLIKAAAADPTTSIADVRYGGKSIEQIEEEQRMAKDTQAAAAGAESLPAETSPAPAAGAPPPGSAVEAALGSAQAQIGQLTVKAEQADLARQAAEARLAEAEAARDKEQARAAAAEAQLQAAAEAAAKAGRGAARLAELVAMAAGIKRVLFADEAAQAALLAQIVELTDEQFITYRLQAEIQLLKEGKPVETAETPVQASAVTAPVFGFLTGGGGTASDPAAIGARLAKLAQG